ncbi:acyltransferase domain-containing protein, partial [Myxococcota bacterium]|nr:acyltransferase domain-containing protein [Myxococcota bacterium]
MKTERGEQDGIAIIGIGCRYPGVHGPLDFLDLIRSDRSTVSAPPASRIQHGYDIDRYLDPRARVPGKISSPYAGFLDHIEQFDPAPFGLIPRDVRAMEPQQRLMLEATWDALMDAGIPADQLQGERVAVIIGHMIEDYSRERIAVLGEDTVNRSLDVFTVMGMSRAALSGRISFLLGLTGPSMTLDTACSSALISIHLACRSLWAGESTMALAGGVNLFVTAEGNIALSRSGMLSPDGACKAFDADANGFVRGEGAGLLLLRPLRDALAHNDPIYAVIRGTGISTDGRDGGHMMAPGRKGQAQAMQDAYAQANRSPADVDFVETHGTGTVIGDPVEIGALADVMGPGRAADKPLRVSSVKGHIGHSESASGAAGLICASLSLAHRELPAQMHFRTPSPHIPWDEIPVRVQAKPEPWPGAGPRLAGVNSFGISGTNAHVVLESAPDPAPETEVEARFAQQPPYLFPISAHDANALEATLRQIQDQLQSEAPPRLEDLAYTLGPRRQHHRHRAALVAQDHSTLAAEIDGLLRGQESGASTLGVSADATEQGVIFVFPGQGGQTEGMGRELFEQEPLFRASIESLDAEFSRHVDWSLVDAIRDPRPTQTLQRLSRLQPTLIAVEIALAELWSHWGVRPDAVIGQSLGEIAAAFIAGALDQSTVARLACERGKIVEQASGSGAMAAVLLEEERLAERLTEWKNEIEIAGITSPSSALVSGNRDAILDFVAQLDTEDIFARTLEVDFASHCFHMDPLLEPFHARLEGMASRAGRIPIYSTVDECIVAGEELDRDYWVRNLRAPVRFSSTLSQALEAGGRKVIEVSPHPTLARAIPEIAEHAGAPVRTVSSLVRDRGERASLMRSLAALYADGQEIDFKVAGPRGRVIRTLPYPYQRQRFWFAQRSRADLPRSDHDWLGARIELAGSPHVNLWQARLDRDNCPFLEDYQLEGPRVLPASVLIEAALAAAQAIWPDSETRLLDVSFWPLARLSENEKIELQIRLTKETPETGSISIMSRETRSDTWSERVQAHVDARQGPVPVGLPLESLRTAQPEQADDCYARLAEGGLQFGRRMRTLRRLTRERGHCEAELILPPISESESYAYSAHPALLETGLALCAPNQ